MLALTRASGRESRIGSPTGLAGRWGIPVGSWGQGAEAVLEVTSARVLTDELLVGRARSGHAADFDLLVQRYADRVYRFCLRHLGDAEAAEDVAQTAFVEAFASLPRFDSRKPFGPWLFGIAANQCRLWHRRRRRARWWGTGSEDSEERLEAVPDETHSPEEVLEDEDRRRQVHRAVAGLPVRYREVILLRYLQGMSTREVAEALGLKPEAAAKRLTRGLQMLRDRLGELGFAGGDLA